MKGQCKERSGRVELFCVCECVFVCVLHVECASADHSECCSEHSSSDGWEHSGAPAAMELLLRAASPRSL